MRRLLTLFGVATLLLAPIFAGAATAELRNPGLTPTNPFYSLDLATEWVQLNVFTYNENRHALMQLEQAEERLSELKVLHDNGSVTALRAHQLSSRYENSLSRFRSEYELRDAAGEGAELDVEFRERIRLHVDTLDEVEDESEDDIAEQVKDALEDAEKEEEDAIDEHLEDDDLTADEEKAEAERKMARADEEISEAQVYIDAQTALGVDMSEFVAALERAKVFLAQSHAAFLDGEYELAHGLAAQAREIASHVEDGKLDDHLVDDTSEKAYEKILDADERIAEAEKKLAENKTTDEVRVEVQALIDAAKADVAEARAALDADEFVLGYELAKQARALANQAKDLADDGEDDEGDDELNDDDADDLQEHALEKINDADEKITEAELKIAERLNEGKESDGTAEALLASAEEKLLAARSAYALGNYVEAYTYARQSKSLASESKEGEYFDSVDVDEVDDDEEKELEEEDENEDEDENEEDEVDEEEERDEDEEKIRERREQEKLEEEQAKEDQEKYEEEQKQAEERLKEQQKEEEERLKEEQEAEEERQKQEEERLKEEQEDEEDEEEDEPEEEDEDDDDEVEDEEEEEDEEDDD